MEQYKVLITRMIGVFN